MRRGETLTAAGQIAMGLAHEIRNPLGAIRGAVQLLKRELGDEARWGEYIEVLLKEVDRVNRIIEMLLDLGRPVTLRPVPLNIHQLLERVALMSEALAAPQNVQIIRSYDPSLPPILADEDRVVQVFHNLVRNAIEAMPAGGRVTLVTRLSMDPLFAKVDLGLGLKSMALVQAGDVADHGEGGSHRAGRAGQRRRHDAHVDRAALGVLDDRIRFGAALTGCQRLAQVAEERCLGREDVLEPPAERAP